MPAKFAEVGLAVVADVHAGLTPPVFRATEPDWFEAQARPWKLIRRLCRKHDCSLAICGDLFDRWDARPEVVNWLMGQLPRKQKVYAVPGNHDLPNHDISQMRRTAYWTLVNSRRVVDVAGMGLEISPHVWLTGFGQGQSLGGHDAIYVHGEFPKGMITVAIVHDYCWDTGRAFAGAPQDKHWSAHLKAAGGAYRVLCFGDNHSGFVAQDESRAVVNCGGLMIRNSDELDRKPCVTLVHADGSVSQVPIDTSEDKYDLEYVKDVKGFGLDEDTANEMVAAAKELGGVSIDFRRVLRDLARSQGVRRTVLELLKEWTKEAEDKK